MAESIDIFISYTHADESYRQQLETHLIALQRQGLIRIWHDRKIAPGAEWAREIDSHLNAAHLILLLVSPDFIASDYCYGDEVTRAMWRCSCHPHYCPPHLLAEHSSWKTAALAYGWKTGDTLVHTR